MRMIDAGTPHGDPNLDPFVEVDSDELVEEGIDEIGNDEIGNDEIGAAVLAVVEKARDSRQPPPTMRAVDADAPLPDGDAFDPFAGELGAGDPFPLTSKLLLRFGAGREAPRYVRVDTEESYQAFRAESSPELAELKARVDDLATRFAEHADDPDAHEMLVAEAEQVDLLGEDVAGVEEEKQVDVWLPEWARGKVRAWREGGYVCASINLPGCDGDVRVCTSIEPFQRCFAEMRRHAAEAGAGGTAVVGVLPAMSCVLGAGTLVKEMAAAAPSILRRPEASRRAPFVVRIEPRANPAVCAMAALAQQAAGGDKPARAEWDALGAAAGKGAKVVGQAMREALALLVRRGKVAA